MKKTAILSIGIMCLMALTVLAPAASAASDPAWTFSYALGETRAQATVLQTANGVVYVCGGVVTTAYTPVTTVSAYNPDTGAWLNVASMPSATRGACGEVGADGRLYVIEGTTTGTRIYNVTTDSWSTGTTAPTDQWEAKSAVHGNSIYVFGGSHNDQNETQIYDIIADSWTYGADMPYNVYAGAVVYDDDYAYYFGGNNLSGFATTNASKYSFASDSWTRIAPLPMAVCGQAAVIGPDGLVYMFGGADKAFNTGMGEVYSDTFVYNIATDSWTTGADMNVPRAWLGAAISGEKILAIGGNDPSNVYSIVEAFDTLPSQLNQLMSKYAALQTQLDQTKTDLLDQISDLDDANAQLKQDLVNLNATLNQTKSNLNNAIDQANANADDANSAASGANMMALIGVLVGIIGIVLAIVAIMMAKKGGKSPQMVAQPGQVQQ